MKKFMSLLFVSVVALAGCGGSASGSSDGQVTEITLWTASSHYFLGDEKVDKDGNTYRDESTAVYQIAADEFEKETGIKVNFKRVEPGNENVDSLVKQNDASVDIYAAAPTMTDDQIIEYMEPQFDSVESCEKEYRNCDMFVQSDGNIYAQVPSISYDGVIVYNEEVIKAAGYDEVPTDIDEFMNMLQAIKDNGVTPIAEHRIENWPLNTFTLVASYMDNKSDALGELLNYEDPFSVDSPMGKTELLMAEMVEKGYFEQSTYADFGVAMDSVAYGDSGMMLLGNWVAPQIISRIPEGETANIKVAPFPKAKDDAELNVSIVPNVYFYIPKGSDAKDESQQFIDYLKNNEDIQKAWAATPNLADENAFVETIPDYVSDFAARIEDGEIVTLPNYVYSPNTLASQEILKDMGVYADAKFIGNVYDAAQTGGVEAAKKELESLNKQWKAAKEARGVEYQEVN
ncbi:ABC transporter substrate-binding protein [Mollicutes bacterium LVI A0039]|nr:ABC transporter substrate-binding protein [Mollicutes bacterium LVI A0039]